MKNKTHRGRWVEGLDWMRVEDILDPDRGGSPELYTTLLQTLLDSLSEANPDLNELINTEVRRRLDEGKMSQEQGEYYAEALRRSIKENERQINEIEKLLKRGQLHVVK